MARPDFFQENAARSFPLVHGTVSGGMAALPDSVLVDCGFVMGPASRYAGGDVRLASVTRSGDAVSLEFLCDDLPGSPVRFVRSVPATGFVSSESEYPEADGASLSGSLSESHSGPPDCGEPVWWGYLVTGDLSSLPQGTLLGGEGLATVEPALVEDLYGYAVSSVSVANSDRTRVEPDQDCDEAAWPFDVGGVFVDSVCLSGVLLLEPGYNASVRQEDAANAVVLGASEGAGAGPACQEVPLFAGETPSVPGGPLGGGPGCDQVLRSIDGIGGGLFHIAAGRGVSVEPVASSSRLIVRIDLAGLPGCAADDGSLVSVSEPV